MSDSNAATEDKPAVLVRGGRDLPEKGSPARLRSFAFSGTGSIAIKTDMSIHMQRLIISEFKFRQIRENY